MHPREASEYVVVDGRGGEERPKRFPYLALRGARAEFGLFGLSSEWISEKRGADARASSL